MKITVILGHPYVNSFNHAIADRVLKTLQENRHQVFYHDLYGEKFDPLIACQELVDDVSGDEVVQQYCDEIKKSDGIIIIHPNWWGQPPAIVKGWVDRVLRMGIAYKFEDGDQGGGVPEGLLIATKAIVFNTSNTLEDRELKVFGDPLERIWRDCIFDFCGIKKFERKIFRVIAASTYEQRKEWLAEVEKVISDEFPNQRCE